MFSNPLSARRCAWLWLVCLFGITPKAQALTEVEGTVSGTWEAAGNPFVVTGNMIIATGTSLTIEPGVEVRFQPNLWLQVNGTLHAQGSPGNEVVFTSNSLTPASGDWYSIYVENDADITFDHTWVEYAGGSSWDAVDTFSGRGIALNWNGGGVRYSANHGIDVVVDAVTLSNITVHSCDGTGIELASTTPPVLANLNIANNSGRALDLTANPGNIPSTITATGNGQNGIFLNGAVGAGAPGNFTWDWNPSAPIVVDRVSIFGDVALTVGAGSILKFLDTNSNLEVSTGGTLATLGGAARGTGGPVWLTSFRDDSRGGDTNGDGAGSGANPGDWEALFVQGGATVDLDETWIAYAGSISWSGVSSFSGSATSFDWNGGGATLCAANGAFVSATDLQLQNLEFSQCGSDGLEVSSTNPAVLSEIQSNDNGGRAIVIDTNPGDLPGTLTGAGNAINGVVVSGLVGGGTAGVYTWSANPGFPYVISGSLQIQSGITLDLSAEVVVKFLGDTSDISVSGGALLRTLGSLLPGSGGPVYFTSIADDEFGGDTNGDGATTPAAPGDWEAIFVGTGADIEFTETWLRYGGQGAWGGLHSIPGFANSVSWNGGGAQFCLGSGLDLQTDAATFQNLTLEGNGIDGMEVSCNSPIVLDNLDSRNNGGRAYSLPTGAGNLPSTLTASGNGINGVVVGNNLPGAGTWQWNTRTEVPVVIANDFDIQSGQTLEIGAGGVVKLLTTNSDIEVFGGGTLRTVGLSTLVGNNIDRPVWITSIHDDAHGGDTNGNGNATTPAPGDWLGFFLQNGSVGDLQNTWFSFGGSSTWDQVDTSTGSATSLTWNGGGSIFSGNHGLAIAAQDVDVQFVRFSDNGGTGVEINASVSATFSNCDIVDNGFGMSNLRTSPSIDARDCWWGDATGPFDPTDGNPDFNPDGLGQEVSDFVIYRDFRTAPATNQSPDGFVLGSPTDGETDVSPDDVVFNWSASVDPDGDPVTYDVAVATDLSFENAFLVAEATGVSGLSWEPDSSLPGETELFWRVVARDAQGGSTLSTPSSSSFRTGESVAASMDEAPHVSSHGLHLGMPSPNPSWDQVSFRLQTPEPTTLRLVVIDAQGREIYRTARQAPAGSHTIAWSGRNRFGDPVPSGAYFVRVRASDKTWTRRVIRVQ